MQREPHKRTTDHSLTEDAMAFVLGTMLCALSIQFLTHLGLITGQTAGLGVLLSYGIGVPFGAIFFVINLPFYVLGYLRMGARFVIKSFIAVALLSVMADQMPHYFSIDSLHPALGALLAGGTAGLGLIVLFRHGASLGGVGILGLVLQERAGIQAGWVQLAFDALLFVAAFFVFTDVSLMMWSLLGAVITNLIVAVNHRQDRYVGR